MIKTVKKIIKHILHRFAARFGRHTRNSSTPQLLVLMYHRIMPLDDERTHLEEPGMVVSPETFQRNLEILSNYFDFVHLSDWLYRKKQGLPLPEKACAITFDDGWIDNYEFAFPVLTSLNIPATIFLVAEMIDTTRKFWPERISQLAIYISDNNPECWPSPDLLWLTRAKTSFDFSSTKPTREQISELIAHCKQYSDLDIHSKIDAAYNKMGIQEPAGAPSLLSWDQVMEMSESGIIKFGSHTCNHIRLGQHVEQPLLEKEIIQSQSIIQNKTGQRSDSFCFPNGDYCSGSVELVKQTYIGAVTTEYGWNSIHSNPHKLKRIGVHEDIANDDISFRARISGWI